MKNPVEPKSNNWLQRLKDESWEAELLVSVASIFAVFKTFDGLKWIVDFFINHLTPDLYYYGYMICFFTYIALGILGSFFVVHFGLRAYWIGLVGLNSVFPDYSIEHSAYSKIYTEKMSNALPKLPQTIKNLDEVCSVLFSAAFTFLIQFLYLAILGSIYLLLFNFLKDTINLYILLIPAIIFIISYLIFTFFGIVANLKKFKNNNTLQNGYYKVVIWGSALFLGPFYKYSLQTSMIFGSNFKKKKAIVITLISMLFIGMFLGVFQIFQSNVGYLLNSERKLDLTKMEMHYYQNQATKKNFLLTPQIESDIVSGNVLKLFVPIFNHEINILEVSCTLNDLEYPELPKDEESQLIKKAYLNCYNNQIQIYLNNIPIDINFLKTSHPTTEQFGIISYISLENITSGQHTITIKKQLNKEMIKEWVIPFYYPKD